MMSDLFSAFLLDTWNEQKEIPANDRMFLALPARRIPFQAFLKRRSVQTHPQMRTFVTILEQASKIGHVQGYPLFSQAYRKCQTACQLFPYQIPLWHKEIARLLQASGMPITYEQHATPKPLSTGLQTLPRRSLDLLGGSRIFRDGQLEDTSWRGRVQAFTQRITL